ncbi:MAG: glycosyltransferase family 4 protein [Desulfobulbaceae bacterium]
MSSPVLGMVLKGYPRISETFISNEILLLEELGLRVRIFSMRHPREPFAHASVEKIRARVDYLPTELIPEFGRLLLPAALEAVRQPHPFLGLLRTAGERFARTRSLGTLKHLLQGAYLVNRFLRSSPEVVHLHAHFAHSPASVAMFASSLAKTGFSFTAHAKDIYTSHPEQLREKMERASFVVTCTGYNREYLTGLGGKNNSVHRVYHGIDLRLFNGHHHRRIPSPPYRILTVARLTPKKGIPTILRALALLRERSIPFEYTLIGDGDEREAVLGMICDLGLRESCRWLGTLPHEKVIREFEQADLFALGCEIGPDGDRDGIPNVLVESLAMGLPAVATTVSALPEIIRDRETGLLSPPGDPRSMADNMERLLTDRELRLRLSRQGREHVRASFDNRLLIRELAGIYCRNIPQLHCA